MANSKEVITTSETAVISEADSQLSTLLYDLSNQVQSAMENMLKMTGEISQSGAEISEEIERCRQAECSRSQMLSEEKERFQKAALAALEMLHHY